MIKIQKNDFNIDEEISLIKEKNSRIGAISTFIGYVRDINQYKNSKKVISIELEVYEKMAYKSLEQICIESKKKWEIIDNLIIHRYGNLKVNEKIVLVASFSIHRKDSYEACNFIMDYLKKDAPFWKKELYENSYQWIENAN